MLIFSWLQLLGTLPAGCFPFDSTKIFSHCLWARSRRLYYLRSPWQRLNHSFTLVWHLEVWRFKKKMWQLHTKRCETWKKIHHRNSITLLVWPWWNNGVFWFKLWLEFCPLKKNFKRHFQSKLGTRGTIFWFKVLIKTKLVEL